MNKFTDYLIEKYHPLAVITYGSFSRGDNDAYSDFDCILIVEEKSCGHDSTVIDGTPLDCFIYTRDEISSEDIEPFLPAYDGTVLRDTDGIAAALKQRVRDYAAAHAVMPEEEKQFIIGWIRKTMHRAEKNDDEGSFRALAFLWESLADYFQLRDMFYLGSKKGVIYLKAHDLPGYELYHAALTERTNEAIRRWAEHVIDIG